MRVTGDETQETMGNLLPTVHIERETSGYEADITMYLLISRHETTPSKRNKVAPSPPPVQSCLGLTAHAYISGVRRVTVNNIEIGEGENGLSICDGKLSIFVRTSAKNRYSCNVSQQFLAEVVAATLVLHARGGTWVFFGWVYTARDSKLPPRSRKNFP